MASKHLPPFQAQNADINISEFEEALEAIQRGLGQVFMLGEPAKILEQFEEVGIKVLVKPIIPPIIYLVELV